MLVKINIPKKIEKNYNELTAINENAVAALVAYKDYAVGYKSLDNIADDLNISKISLVNIYEKVHLPLIMQSDNNFNKEIKLDKYVMEITERSGNVDKYMSEIRDNDRI